MKSLWGEEFNIPDSKDQVKAIKKKESKPKDISIEKAITSTKIPLSDRLALVNQEVKRVLSVYSDRTQVIKTKEDFHNYISYAIDNGFIAVDTETNKSLDPLTCKLMGLCLYIPNHKNTYIPVNHTDIDGNKYQWQITEDDIKNELSRLYNTKIIMHNGKFDYEVLKCTCNIELNVYWDTMIAARLLNENERAGLKEQYISKIDPSIEKYSIEKFFKTVDYNYVDPEVFALYAATDAFMTYKLYELQEKEFKNYDKLYNLFMTVEMPILKVAADMELTGVNIDIDYANRLSRKYHKKLDDIDEKINIELSKLSHKIDDWRKTPEANYRSKKIVNGVEKYNKSKSEQFPDNINVESSTQMAILFYDILGIGVIDKDNPRGTGEDILNQIKHPLSKLILERRSLSTLINSFIDKLPKNLSEVDNRLHGHFNQLGTDTGRFSSNEPNLQNIPSNESSIRLMFIPTKGYTMIGSDYSAQEPRLLAAYSQDDFMVKSLNDGRDPYSTIAVGVYHNNYEDNLEEYPDGSLYLEGKHRRKSIKKLLLGIMYGMQIPAIAELLDVSQAEAKNILNDFYDGFPKIKVWMDESINNAKKYGYVEDLWGRRRRLPDILLPEYEIKSTKNDFNPLIGSKNIYQNLNTDKINYYLSKLKNSRSKKDSDTIINEALKDDISIKRNGGFISRAERQCVNARIQGGASTMTKKAMLLIHNDEDMKNYGFRLLLAVHDELIGECPIEYSEKAKDRLSYLMRIAAQPECNIKMKCDALVFPRWYYDVYSTEISDRYKELLEEYDKEKSFSILKEEYSEMLEKDLEEILFDKS